MTGPRRVDLVITSLGIGGAQVQLAHLLRGLVAAGRVTRLFTLLPPPEPSPVLDLVRRTGVEVTVLGRGVGGPLRATDEAVRTWRRDPPDAVVSLLYHANVLSRLAARAADVPTVVSSIRNEHFGGPARDLVVRTTDRLATVTVANSHQTAAALVARRVVRPERLAVVPNAVDLAPRSDRSRQQVRARHGLGDDFVWLTVGRMTDQKDHATLLAALAACADAAPTARLWIAGDGPERPALETAAATLGIHDRVRFLGFRTDVEELLHAVDGFVLSSRWEGSPNAVLEALSVGVPVVATDVGGVRDLLAPGTAVAPGDVDSLATQLRRVMALSPAARRREVARGWSVVRVRHGVAAVTAQWLDVLDRAAAASRPRPRTPSRA